MIPVVLYYLCFLDHELSAICFTHKMLMSRFKLLLVKLYILLTPSSFVFTSHWNAGGHFASWIQRHRQLWPMELRGSGWGWRGSGEAPGQNYKTPPTIKALSSGFVVPTHTYTPICLLLPLKQFSRRSLAYQRYSSRGALYWIRLRRANVQGAC